MSRHSTVTMVTSINNQQSPLVDLFTAYWSKSRWSSCTRDSAHVQDRQRAIQPAGQGLDAQVRHVVDEHNILWSATIVAGNWLTLWYVVHYLTCVFVRMKLQIDHDKIVYWKYCIGFNLCYHQFVLNVHSHLRWQSGRLIICWVIHNFEMLTEM